ncbi:unnamed protein product [Didymodactylos carnosus]|uniref:Uncharacterized protein n=1 Tax=Didymodactylos carnosus TaxID=1234261 RepID=A0A813VFG3_9BILA|nr:unnamed protein product [Didymodactylos carnosus]CAF0842203.1 unnamed protein product [Didymodactylos carnosus]CAF3562834.1 unnamed protein product [Didymodactylos carnosus]CAF3629527.1 unnamed protein product [Didymodactylos carnosus]
MHKPDTIIVGSNIVSAETLQKWRNTMKRYQSLSNTKCQCTNIIEKLSCSNDKRENILSPVIGCGAIRKRVIQRLIHEGHTVIVYDPSLANCSSRVEPENVARSKGIFCHEGTHFVTSPEEAVKNVYYVAFAIDAVSVVTTGGWPRPKSLVWQ